MKVEPWHPPLSDRQLPFVPTADLCQ
jgi:hypothetical protein